MVLLYVENGFFKNQLGNKFKVFGYRTSFMKNKTHGNLLINIVVSLVCQKWIMAIEKVIGKIKDLLGV